MIVAGDLNFGGPGNASPGPHRHVVRVHRHVQPRERPALDEARRRVPALRQRELRRRHGRVQLPERRGLPGRNRQCLQHHARRAAERHRSARHGPVRSGPDRRYATTSRSNSGMRYEWHVTPTERDNRFVVFDAPTRVARARRRGSRQRSIGRTTGTSSRGSAWPGISHPTAGRCCAPPTRAAVDEPGTTAVRDTAGNPPFAAPLTAAGVDSARQRHRHDAARRARARHGRSAIPERVAAVVERQRAAAARAASWP